jgi:hypothetical protein
MGPDQLPAGGEGTISAGLPHNRDDWTCLMRLHSVFLLSMLPALSCGAAPNLSATGHATPSGQTTRIASLSDSPELRRLMRFKPFHDESDALTLGDLSIENRTDRVELYGTLSITRDKEGLALAQALRHLCDVTIDALQARPLPDRIERKPSDTVASPFAPD